MLITILKPALQWLLFEVRFLQSHIFYLFVIDFNINFPSRSRSSKRHFPLGRRTHNSFLIMDFSLLPPSFFFLSILLADYLSLCPSFVRNSKFNIHKKQQQNCLICVLRFYVADRERNCNGNIYCRCNHRDIGPVLAKWFTDQLPSTYVTDRQDGRTGWLDGRTGWTDGRTDRTDGSMDR